jgi:2-dehydro-3-deoxyphosphogluconate aldolase/(4S)-4-hydroxy-2-oxoglutarate aldolase
MTQYDEERGEPEYGRTDAVFETERYLTIAPVIPVIVIDDAGLAEPLARALLAGGLRVVEITLRTPAAREAIRRIRVAAPEMSVGAGTVLTRHDLEAAAHAGAQFALAPGATPKLMKAAVKFGEIAFIPGVSTPTEIMRGIDLGYRCFKFFPAEALGGPPALSAIAGPLPDARFCPTGSINAERAPSYLALRNVLCVGGSWIASPQRIAARDWAGIEASARQAAALAR